jgi:hypothetical protein
VLATTTQSPWYAVAAGLAAALIVAVVSYVVARQQRKADMERLDRQLEQDRTLRADEMRMAAERLERQLANDRYLRDIEHLRVVLQPIIGRAISWLPASEVLARVNLAQKVPNDDDRKALLNQPIADLAAFVSELASDRLTIAVIVGHLSPVALRLGDIVALNTDSRSAANDWLAGSLPDDEFDSLSVSLGQRYSGVIVPFLDAAFKTVGREPPTAVDLIQHSSVSAPPQATEADDLSQDV